MRTRTALPVAGSALAAVALTVGIALVAPGGSDEPQHLRLAAGAATRDAAVTAAAPSGGSGYVLTGTLPDGRPDDAPAYALPGGPADGDVVGRLARALGEPAPVRDGDTWRAGGLVVNGSSGQSWWWSQCAPDTPVSSDAEGNRIDAVRCAVATPGTVDPAPAPADAPVTSPGAKPTAEPSPLPSSGSGSSGSAGSGGTAVAPPPATPVPAPDPMPAAEVRRAVAPVFEALGLSLDDARVEGFPYGGSATLTPRVGDLEVWGMQTSVQVDQDGNVQGANGWLGSPDKGDSYPLLTAKDAFDDLPPVMTAMLCPVGPDGKGCSEPEPLEVTGARLGLVLRPLAEGEQALVPAWLFEIKGWTEPQPVVAVQPQYLDDPSDQATDTPATGKAEPPVVPPADPGTAREPFSFQKAARGDDPDVVVVSYGDNSSQCNHPNPTGVAKEDADHVYVLLEADAPDGDRACTEEYAEQQLTVRLMAPLGDRQVVDASTNEAVPLS